MLFLVLQILFYIILFLVIVLLLIKQWLEPIKGVCRCKVKLNGKVALVTGGNSGIGLETAKNLALKGARVIIASRNVEKSKRAVEDIKRTTKNDKVEYRYLNLGDFSEVKKFCTEFNASEKRLDILVNNAGVAGLKPKLTSDGIDILMQINYYGPFLLTKLLLKKLEQSKPSRIVVVSSVGHKFTKVDEDFLGLKFAHGNSTSEMWYRYANSKLNQILWTKALAKRLPDGVTINALHPGIVETDIFNNFTPFLRNLILIVVDTLFKTAKEGAETSIHLSVAPELENASGGYYSDCKPARHVSKYLKDDERIEKLWAKSVEITEKWTQD